MANRTDGVVKRGAPAQAQPPLHAEVAARPLPPARRVLAIGEVVDRVLETGKEGSAVIAAEGGLAGKAPWPPIGRARLGIAGASWLAFVRWVKTVVLTWRARWWRRSPAPANAGAPSPRPREQEPKVESKLAASTSRVGNQAWMIGPKRRVSRAAVAPDTTTPSTPRRAEQIVGGEVVQSHVVDQYADYCQATSTCPKKTICHMCTFEKQTYGKNKFDGREMLLHCIRVHGTTGLGCEDYDCRVRVRTPRELLLHTHFCHRLSSGWWLRRECR